MFGSNNITITGKSAVLSILYTVVTRHKQTNKKKHEEKNPTHSHAYVIFTLQKFYKSKTRSPESKATDPSPLKPVESEALWDLQF